MFPDGQFIVLHGSSLFANELIGVLLVAVVVGLGVGFVRQRAQGEPPEPRPRPREPLPEERAARRLRRPSQMASTAPEQSLSSVLGAGTPVFAPVGDEDALEGGEHEVQMSAEELEALRPPWEVEP